VSGAAMCSRRAIADRLTLVDGHVHVHACFDLARFLGAAAANLGAAATELGATDRTGVLMLTEGRGERAFVRLRDDLASCSVPGWSIRETSEATSVEAIHDEGLRLTLVAGRQIVTREQVEVLAFNTTAELPDRGGLHETLERVWADGSIAVVPWGFGKWWFRRGRLVRDALKRYRDRPFMLGDNAGRPRHVAGPAMFRIARSLGIAVLPGSDPLPFPSEIGKVGCYGAVLRSGLDPERPGQSVVRELAECDGRLTPFGTRERFPRFVRVQLAMQWRKRRGGAPR
jgi:hypothetical protein